VHPCPLEAEEIWFRSDPLEVCSWERTPASCRGKLDILRDSGCRVRDSDSDKRSAKNP
jgi:hypothetical protein